MSTVQQEQASHISVASLAVMPLAELAADSILQGDHEIAGDAEDVAMPPLDVGLESAALYMAAFAGNNLVIEQLLAAGHDVNQVDLMYGQRALCGAIAGNHLATVKLLLSAKANPSVVDNRDGCSLQHALAAQQGPSTTDIVQALLLARADPNKKDSLGETALYHAVRMGNVAVVDLLLEAKAEVNSQNLVGGSLLDCLLSPGKNPEILERLLKYGVNIRERDGFGHTSLMKLIPGIESPMSSNDQRLIVTLLRAGAEINAKDLNQESVLDYALVARNVQLVEILLRGKADPFAVQARNLIPQDPTFEPIRQAQLSKKRSLAFLSFFHGRMGAQSAILPITRSAILEKALFRDVLLPLAGFWSAKKDRSLTAKKKRPADGEEFLERQIKKHHG